MTAWHRNEYILKGVFLGLWAFVALQVAVDPTAVRIDLPWVLGWMCTGLLVGLIVGTVRQMSRGVKPWDNWAAFPILVLLESPMAIYTGLTLGLAAGVLSGRDFAEPWAGQIANWFGLTFADIRHVQSTALPSDDPQKGKLPGDWLGYCAAAGALLGLGMYRLRQVEDPWWRWGTGLAVAALAVYFGAKGVAEMPGLSGADGAAARFNLGVYILIGLPFFYLLTFCGEAEESEAEIMALCGALGLGIDLMNLSSSIPALSGAVSLLLPITIYFVYSTRVLPGLRVFKHVLRGYSYMNLGKFREAIYFFRRALELDPNSPLANQGMLALHNNLSLSKLEGDPQLVEVLDFGLCLDRAHALLIRDRAPTAADRAEAERFLELVEQKKQAYLARVDYLRAVSRVHAREFDAAAETLRRLLNPETPYHPAVRKQVLYPAWDLALRLHPEVVKRLGWEELKQPGRRIEAIGAVERHLAANPEDADAQGVRRLLYAELGETEFVSAAAGGPPKDFNYEYVEQLGLALIDDPDPDRRERGAAYLRMAGRGLVARGPAIFQKLAEVAEQQGDAEIARSYLEQVKRCGLFVKPDNLAKDQRDVYYAALKKLATVAEAHADAIKQEADAARDRGDDAAMAAKDAEARPHYEDAIDDLRLFLDGRRDELATYRKLADLYGKSRATPNAILNALLMTETGLTYEKTDPDLLKKKDTYYYSVDPGTLATVKEKVAGYFDVGYCVRKAMSVLNSKSDDLELLEWATHLSRLAKVLQPDSNGVRLVEARCLLRKGERDAGIQILEDVREGKKGSGDEEENWYNATRLLGDLYLDELNRPDLAIRAYQDYKEFHKSGADTLYKLGRAYEAQGDHPNAIRFYEAVTAYEAHPRYWEAKDALRRLGKG